ncbi:MAG: aldehyde-activating protein [Gammaproteobacteria bacterium]
MNAKKVNAKKVKNGKPAAGNRTAAAPRPAKAPRARKSVPAAPAAPAEPQSFDGGCHCGAIEYTYSTALPARRWAIRLCQCGFCRGHGIRVTADPAGELQFRFERPEFLRRYRFALRTADFLICKECGTCVAAVLLSGRGAHAVINVNTLRAPPKGLHAGKPVSHDGESGEDRRARRVQAWTPVVGPV